MVERRLTSTAAWFTQSIATAWGRPIASTPEEALSSIGTDPGKYPWVSEVSAQPYPICEQSGEVWPDLEARSRNAKRSHGQYYTPERMVEQLLDTLPSFPAEGPILDPACGAGGFLLPVAKYISTRRSSLLPLSCLHGYDIDPDALLVCLGRLLTRFPTQGFPSLERRDFLLDPPTERFRYIVGNPPYKVNLPENVRQSLSHTYETAEGEKDLYTFFLEAATRALRMDGEVIMLTSHTFLVNHQCDKIRRLLFVRHTPRGLYFLPFRFFPRAPGVLPVITHVTRTPAHGNDFQIFDRYSAESAWQTVHHGDPSLLAESRGLAQIRLDPRSKRLFQDMEHRHHRLGEVCRIGVGIQESLRREGQISRFVRDTRADQQDVPVLRGREIDAFTIQWDGKYLSYGAHLAYSGPEEIFRGPKILYQNLRNESLPVRLVAALDENGFFPKNSLSYIANPEPPFTLAYLTGLLNSPLVNAWFAGNYYSFHVTVTQVRTIPVPLATDDRRSAVEQTVRELMVCAGPRRPTGLLQRLSLEVISCYFPDVPPEEIASDLGLGAPQTTSRLRMAGAER